MRKYLLHQARLVFHWNATAHRQRGTGPITTTYAAKARLKVHQKGRQCQDGEFRSYRSSSKSINGKRQRCARASSAQIRYRQH